MLSLFYDIFFEIIFQILAVIEAPMIFSFQSLVKQIFFVITEAVPHRYSTKKNHLFYTRYKFEEQSNVMDIYFYFNLFSFDQNLNFSKSGA